MAIETTAMFGLWTVDLKNADPALLWEKTVHDHSLLHLINSIPSSDEILQEHGEGHLLLYSDSVLGGALLTVLSARSWHTRTIGSLAITTNLGSVYKCSYCTADGTHLVDDSCHGDVLSWKRRPSSSEHCRSSQTLYSKSVVQ